jgi:hypothetical protein
MTVWRARSRSTAPAPSPAARVQSQEKSSETCTNIRKGGRSAGFPSFGSSAGPRGGRRFGRRGRVPQRRGPHAARGRGRPGARHPKVLKMNLLTAVSTPLARRGGGPRLRLAAR